MNNWYIYYDAQNASYKFTNTPDIKWLAQFTSFDMAYDYVTRMNNVNLNHYSKWTR